jgi:hypothetical protein
MDIILPLCGSDIFISQFIILLFKLCCFSMHYSNVHSNIGLVCLLLENLKLDYQVYMQVVRHYLICM